MACGAAAAEAGRAGTKGACTSRPVSRFSHVGVAIWGCGACWGREVGGRADRRNAPARPCFALSQPSGSQLHGCTRPFERAGRKLTGALPLPRYACAGVAHTFFCAAADKPRAGELINVLREAGQVVPEDLLKFGTAVKKKESKVRGF